MLIYYNYNVHVPVAQLDRVSDSDSEGRAFESHRAYFQGEAPAKELFPILKKEHL